MHPKYYLTKMDKAKIFFYASTLTTSLALLLSWEILLQILKPTCYILDGGYNPKLLIPYILSPKTDGYIALLATLTAGALMLIIGVIEGVWYIAGSLTASILILTTGQREILYALPLITTTPLLLLPRSGDKKIYLVYLAETLLALIAILEISTLAYYTGIALSLNLPLVHRAASWDLALFYWLHPLVPALVLTFLFSPLLKLALKALETLLGKEIKIKGKEFDLPLGEYKILAIALLLSIFLGSILYLPTINPEGKYKGVDPITRYDPHLRQIYSSEDRLKAIVEIGYDRPLMYLGLYLLSKILGIEGAVKAMPALCAALFTLSVYLLAKTCFKPGAAKLATLLAPTSYTVTAGLMGGLYNNWIALSLSLLATTFLLRYLRGSWINAVIFALLYFTVIATHVYMGVIYAATLPISVLLAIKPRDRKYLWRIGPIIAIVSILALTAALYAFQRPVTAYYKCWSRSIGLSFTGPTRLFGPKWWEIYLFSIYNYAASAGIDLIGWSLALLGILSTDLSKPINKILAAWLLVTGPMLIVASNWLMWRVLYDVPVALYEALGMYTLLSTIERKEGLKLALLSGIALILLKANYALRFAEGMTFTSWP